MDTNTNTSVAPNPTRIPPPRGYALSGKIMLAAIVVLFSIVLLILFVHLYARFHLIRRRRRLIFTSGGRTVTASRGLDPTVLNSLAVTVFSSEDANVAECAVCLSEFEEGEKVRLLPRCDHRFHIGCIDMWFGSHNSCPLCRTPVEIESAEAEKAVAGRQCADPEVGSSSDSVSIDITDREEELGLGLGFGFRLGAILAVKRFWSRDRELDLEQGTSPAARTAAAAE